jgi:hypothetical protein
MVKLFVIPAKTEPTAVILRRGPSAWYHVIQWATRRDVFVHGAWIKGRIYDERCDISPDGRLLLYFIHQGSRFNTEFTDSWTAVSRVPWLHALAVWPQGTTYNGGGRFIDNWTIALRGVWKPPLEKFPLGRIRVIEAETPLQQATENVPDADWCGRDHDDRIVFTRAGCLFRRTNGKDALIADFMELKPDPHAAPDWAGQPV